MTRESIHGHGVFLTECFGPEHRLLWRTLGLNMVVDQGKNHMLDTYFSGAAYTASWYMSLIGSGPVSASATYAAPTVVEVGSDIIGGRVAIGWMSAAGATKASVSTVFAILGAGTISGNFVVQGASTVGDTAAGDGILFSAAHFAGGAKTVAAGYTLSVSYTISL